MTTLGTLTLELSAPTARLESDLRRAQEIIKANAINFQAPINWGIVGSLAAESRQAGRILQEDLKRFERMPSAYPIKLKLDISGVEEAIDRVNRLGIVVKVDDSRLFELNKHLDIKQKHLKETVEYFKANPITTTTEYKDGKPKARSGGSSNASTNLLGVILSPLTSTLRGAFEGIGRELSRGWGKGMASAIESQLFSAVGSTELLSNTIYSNLFKGLKLNLQASLKPQQSQLLSDLLQVLGDEIGQENILVESKARIGKKNRQNKANKKIAQEQVASEFQENFRSDQGFAAYQSIAPTIKRVDEVIKRSQRGIAAYNKELAGLEQSLESEKDNPNADLIGIRNQILDKKRDRIYLQEVIKGANQRKEELFSQVANTPFGAFKKFQSNQRVLDDAANKATLKQQELADLQVQYATEPNIVTRAKIKNKTDALTKELDTLTKEIERLQRENKKLQIVAESGESAKKKSTQQVKALGDKDNLPIAYSSLVEEVAGKKLKGKQIPKLVVDDSLADRQAEAEYEIKGNIIRITSEMQKAIMDDRLSSKQMRVLRHELFHARDFNFGGFDGIQARRNNLGIESRKARYSPEQLADVAPYISTYDPKVQGLESYAEIKAREGLPESLKLAQQRAVKAKIDSSYGFAGGGYTSLVNNQFNGIRQSLVTALESGKNKDEISKLIAKSNEIKQRALAKSLELAKVYQSGSLEEFDTLSALIDADFKDIITLKKEIEGIGKKGKKARNRDEARKERNDPWSESPIKEKLTNFAISRINKQLNRNDPDVIDLNPRITSFGDLTARDYLQLAGQGIGDVLRPLNYVAGGVRRGYQIAEGVERAVLPFIPMGREVKSFGKNVALPMAAYGALGMLPGGAAIQSTATGFIGDVLSLPAAGAIDALSGAVGGSAIGGVVSNLPFGIGSAIGGALTESVGSLVTAGISAIAPLIAGKTIVNATSHALGAALPELKPKRNDFELIDITQQRTNQAIAFGQNIAGNLFQTEVTPYFGPTAIGGTSNKGLPTSSPTVFNRPLPELTKDGPVYTVNAHAPKNDNWLQSAKNAISGKVKELDDAIISGNKQLVDKAYQDLQDKVTDLKKYVSALAKQNPKDNKVASANASIGKWEKLIKEREAAVQTIDLIVNSDGMAVEAPTLKGRSKELINKMKNNLKRGKGKEPSGFANLGVMASIFGGGLGISAGLGGGLAGLIADAALYTMLGFGGTVTLGSGVAIANLIRYRQTKKSKLASAQGSVEKLKEQESQLKERFKSVQLANKQTKEVLNQPYVGIDATQEEKDAYDRNNWQAFNQRRAAKEEGASILKELLAVRKTLKSRQQEVAELSLPSPSIKSQIVSKSKDIVSSIKSFSLPTLPRFQLPSIDKLTELYSFKGQIESIARDLLIPRNLPVRSTPQKPQQPTQPLGRAIPTPVQKKQQQTPATVPNITTPQIIILPNQPANNAKLILPNQPNSNQPQLILPNQPNPSPLILPNQPKASGIPLILPNKLTPPKPLGRPVKPPVVYTIPDPWFNGGVEFDIPKASSASPYSVLPDPWKTQPLGRPLPPPLVQQPTVQPPDPSTNPAPTPTSRVRNRPRRQQRLALKSLDPNDIPDEQIIPRIFQRRIDYLSDRVDDAFIDGINKPFQPKSKKDTVIEYLRNLKEQAKGLFTGLGALAALGIVSQVILAQGQAALQTASAFEQLQLKLQAANGSLQEGKRRFSEVREESKKFGISQQSGLEIAAGIDATTYGSELQGNPSKEFTSQLMSISQARGLSRQQVGSLRIAISQILGKPRVSTEELNQLIESGGMPDARVIGARAMGYTPQQFTKLLESTEGINSRRFASAFLSQAKSDSLIIKDEALNSQQAKLSKLQSSYEDFLLTIGEGISPAFKAGLDVAAGAMDLLTKGVEIGSKVLFGLAVVMIPRTIIGLVQLASTAIASGAAASTAAKAWAIFVTGVKAIGSMAVLAAGLYTIAEGVQLLSDRWKGAGAESEEAAKKMTLAIERTRKEMGKGFGNSLNLPEEYSDVKGKNWLDQWGTSMQNTLGGAFNGIQNWWASITGGSPSIKATNSKEIESMQRVEKLDMLITAGQPLYKDIADAIKAADKLKALDIQLNELGTRRSAIFTTNPNDSGSINKIDAEYRKVFQQRNEAAKPSSNLQSLIQQQLNNLQNEQGRLDDLANQPNPQITRPEYIQSSTKIRIETEKLKKLQEDIGKAIKSTLDDLSIWTRQLDIIIDKFSVINDEFKIADQRNNIGRNQAEESGILTKGQAQYRASIDNQFNLADKRTNIVKTIKELLESLNLVDPKALQNVFKNYKVDFNTSAGKLGILAQSASNPTDKVVLEKLAVVRQQRMELLGLENELSNARMEFVRRVKEENKEAREYYLGLARQVDPVNAAYNKKLLDVSTQKNRLISKLNGFGNGFADNYINSIMELFESSRRKMELMAEYHRAQKSALDNFNIRTTEINSRANNSFTDASPEQLKASTQGNKQSSTIDSSVVSQHQSTKLGGWLQQASNESKKLYEQERKAADDKLNTAIQNDRFTNIINEKKRQRAERELNRDVERNARNERIKAENLVPAKTIQERQAKELRDFDNNFTQQREDFYIFKGKVNGSINDLIEIHNELIKLPNLSQGELTAIDDLSKQIDRLKKIYSKIGDTTNIDKQYQRARTIIQEQQQYDLVVEAEQTKIKEIEARRSKLESERQGIQQQLKLQPFNESLLAKDRELEIEIGKNSIETEKIQSDRDLINRRRSGALNIGRTPQQVDRYVKQRTNEINATKEKKLKNLEENRSQRSIESQRAIASEERQLKLANEQESFKVKESDLRLETVKEKFEAPFEFNGSIALQYQQSIEKERADLKALIEANQEKQKQYQGNDRLTNLLNQQSQTAQLSAEKKIKALEMELEIALNTFERDKLAYQTDLHNKSFRLKYLDPLAASIEGKKFLGKNTQSDEFLLSVRNKQMDYNDRVFQLEQQRDAIKGTTEESTKARESFDAMINQLRELEKIDLSNLAMQFDPVNQSIKDIQKSTRDVLGEFANTGKLDIKKFFRQPLEALSGRLLDAAVPNLFQNLYRQPDKNIESNLPSKNSNWLSFIGGMFGLGKFSSGGMIGNGKSAEDDQLILAQRGEAILSHKAVDILGVDRIKDLNLGKLPKFSSGGMIGNVLPSMSELKSSSNNQSNVNIAVNGDSNRSIDDKRFVRELEAVVTQVMIKHKRSGFI